jgi:hypothetical protein
MANDEVLQRIAAWEAAGLINADTAQRLRAAEAAADVPPGTPAAAMPAQAVSSFFGPIPTIAELFGYVGAASSLRSAT